MTLGCNRHPACWMKKPTETPPGDPAAKAQLLADSNSDRPNHFVGNTAIGLLQWHMSDAPYSTPTPGQEGAGGADYRGVAKRTIAGHRTTKPYQGFVAGACSGARRLDCPPPRVR